ncbi:MAG: hypothetical protein ACOX3S_15190 [Anaerolineae bacterium]|jgi:hypothetical protein
MPIPRGINEGELARLAMVPSQIVKPPSIAECPVNLETVIERIDLYGIHHIVFCRVLGASVDEEFVALDRLEALRRYPTHECDDVDNAWQGAVERLSLLGEVLPCPQFPCGPRRGLSGSFEEWLPELAAANFLSTANLQRLQAWVAQWRQAVELQRQADHIGLRAKLSRAVELAAWEEFDQLNTFVAESEE